MDAVMYVADKRQTRALLDGTGTELGRIGYVAMTRARNLMVLAIPDTCANEFQAELLVIWNASSSHNMIARIPRGESLWRMQVSEAGRSRR